MALLMKPNRSILGHSLKRRDFVRVLGVASAGAIVRPFFAAATPNATASEEQLVRFPEKTELILRTDRPPQLETPLRYFREDLTSNDAFYVRWHLEGIPTSVDAGAFRLLIDGHVEKPLALSRIAPKV